MYQKEKAMAGTLLFISGAEIVVIVLVVLLLFGSKRIPEIARGFGKGMQEIKKATDGIKKEIDDADIKKDIDELTNGVKDIKKNLDKPF